MNWSKVLRIVRREYVESVRKKSFLFGLVATPLLMVGLVFLPMVTGEMLLDERATFAVVDETGEYGARLQETLRQEEASPGGIGPRVEITVYGPEDSPGDASLDQAVIDGDLSGWLRIPAGFEETSTFEYHAESVMNVTAMEKLEIRIGRLLAERKAARYGVRAEDVEHLLRPAKLEAFKIGKEGGEQQDPEQVYLHAVIMVMILFFALMPTGQILMRSVIEEKSNRVVEVLLSSVRPQELMVGKVIGLGAVGLTLIGSWTACGLFLALRQGAAFPIRGDEVGVFLLYFPPGYFLYAALLGAVGSVCNSERETQPFLTPISLMLLLPVMVGLAIAQNPDHVFARVLSFFPFFTPSLMLFRFSIQRPPVWEIAATWGTLVASTVGMFWVSWKVFRVGILLYGKRPTLPEVTRWIGAR